MTYMLQLEIYKEMKFMRSADEKALKKMSKY